MSEVDSESTGNSYHLDASAQGSSRITQLGSGTQYNIETHYHGNLGNHASVINPFDLFALRQWIERISEDFSRQINNTENESSNKEVLRYRKQLEALSANISDNPSASAAKDAVRRLAASGVVQYLARTGRMMPEVTSEQVLIDLMVFALWPIVIAKSLPKTWHQDLLEITGPRVAAITATSREAIAEKRHFSVEDFSRALADKPIRSAIANLFDDLGDPRRGGPSLTAIAIASGLPKPPGGRAKAIAAWVSATLSGVVVGIIATEIGERLDVTGEICLEAIEPGIHHRGGREGVVDHLIEDFLHIF